MYVLLLKFFFPLLNALILHLITQIVMNFEVKAQALLSIC